MDEPVDPDPTWGEVVNRLDVAEHRSSDRIRADLTDAAGVVALAGHDRLHPVERRRRAGLAVWHALAAYRLAGGDPPHLLRVVAAGTVVGGPDDVAGSLGDRARLARARVELALEYVTEADEYAAHVADVEQRAAALERPATGTDSAGRVYVDSDPCRPLSDGPAADLTATFGRR